jgi:hypothetical protein
MLVNGHHQRASLVSPAGFRRPSRLPVGTADHIIATARSFPTIAATASPGVWMGRSTPAT